MSIKKTLTSAISLGLLCVGLRWLHMQVAYAGIESLTEQHGSELAPAVDSIITELMHPTRDLSPTIEYFKIFEYSEDHAKVFVVIRFVLDEPFLRDYDRSGAFFSFVYQGGKWIVDRSRPPEGVWSLVGNADDDTWPPYH